MLQNEPQKQTPYSIIPLIALIIVVGFSIYFESTAFSTEQKIDEITAKIETLSAQQKTADTREGTLSQLELIQQKLASIESNQFFWSRIAEKIDQTVPKQKENGPQIIDIASYSGGENGRIVLNATTRADSPKPFEDIASFITAFSAEPSFARVFVPSITKSLTPEGATVLGFSANLLYQTNQN